MFWIFPDGTLFDAVDSHLANVPRGHEHILRDEPDYGGFLRGRVASLFGETLIVVYCREDALVAKGAQLGQFLDGLNQLPIALSQSALVVSDNADIYGTVADLYERQFDLDLP